MMKIDAVITWVDGNDPTLKAKRQSFGSTELFSAEDIAGDTRYSNLGEIFWCVASLNRFAPFLNKIYIVTDGQNPHVEEFLDANFPQGHIPVEIVDHKVIFSGFEEFLPTFNSISLETMTWRIPGLQEHFIELNDDLMLAAPVTPEDFFTPDGKSVCYAERYNMLWTKFTRRLKRKKNGHERVTFKGSMLNAARLAGERLSFLKLNHTPKALVRSFYEDYFAAHPEDMLRNIGYRFRDAEQFTSQELQYLLLNRMERCELRPVSGNLFFLQPKNRKDYVAKKLARLAKNKRCKFCCFNSIDLATPDERAQIIAWIEGRLNIKLS